MKLIFYITENKEGAVDIFTEGGRVTGTVKEHVYFNALQAAMMTEIPKLAKRLGAAGAIQMNEDDKN